MLILVNGFNRSQEMYGISISFIADGDSSMYKKSQNILQFNFKLRVGIILEISPINWTQSEKDIYFFSN